jgi:hypothetical protein
MEKNVREDYEKIKERGKEAEKETKENGCHLFNKLSTGC